MPFMLIATGAAGGMPIRAAEDPRYDGLLAALEQVCGELARDIVRDGEGATKFVTVHVHGGDSAADCLKVAYAVAESPLVKTALFASDANWGRILAAVGRAGAARLDLARWTSTSARAPSCAAGSGTWHTEKRAAQ